MAKETQIKYEGRGFWLLENNLLLLMFFLYEAAEEKGISSFNPHFKTEYIEDMEIFRSGECYGMVHLQLMDIVTSEAQRSEFISILNDAKTRINNKYPDIIPPADLLRFENIQTSAEKEGWVFPVHKSSILNLIDLIILLLDESKEFPHQGKHIRLKDWPSWEGQVVV